MASSVCFYFQVHQPHRLRDLRAWELGTDRTAFDQEENRRIFRKVAEKCYLPANRLLLQMLKKHPECTVAFSLSGTFLDQCEEYGPDVLESFKALVQTGQVELLAETYYHSLSSIRSVREFCDQVELHVRAMERHFGVTPAIFRNTELIYSNEIAEIVRNMGFHGILAEGVDHILNGRTPTIPYRAPSFALPDEWTETIAQNRPVTGPACDISILLKHYRLSDDIAFRFSDTHWPSHPLTVETYADWIAGTPGHSVNLFMDYETFGEHQWEDSGIFQFLEALPAAFAARNIAWKTPGQVIDSWEEETDIYDVHQPVSWADMERDLSAWLGNDIQCGASDAVYALEEQVKATNDAQLLQDWRKLLTSDHFYYMCTKHWQDGDVHKYFSPYESPYEAFRRFSHALEDLRYRLAARVTTAASSERESSALQKQYEKLEKAWRRIVAFFNAERTLPWRAPTT